MSPSASRHDRASIEELLRSRLDRRSLLRRALEMGLGGATLAAALAACRTDGDSSRRSTPVSSPSASPPATPVRARILRFADAVEPDSLDPHHATGPYAHLIRALYEPLLATNEQLEALPGLATDWQVHDDRLYWTFRLRAGVRFHDGSEFNAEVVRYNFERILASASAIARHPNLQIIERVEVVDPQTVRFVTRQPFPDLPLLLTDRVTSMVSPLAVESSGGYIGRSPVGIGPFRLSEWLANGQIVLRRFDGYSGKRGNVEQIRFVPLADANSREGRLRGGEVDLAVAPPRESVFSLRADGRLEVRAFDTTSEIHTELRQTKPPFSDHSVRRALNLALDRRVMIERFMNRLASESRTPAPVGIWGSVELDPWRHDPSLAKDLLAKAGYAGGFDANLAYTGGVWPGEDQLAETIKASWDRIGVKTTIHKVDQSRLESWLRDDPDNRAGWTFQVLRASPTTDLHLVRLFHSSSTRAETEFRSGYVNDRVDELLARGNGSFDQNERRDLYREAQQRIWDDAAFTWLFVLQDLIAYRRGISGVRYLPNGELLLGQVEMP